MLSDPSSAWTAKANKRVQFGYGLNYLIDTDESGHRRDPPSHGSCAASIGGVSVEADAPIGRGQKRSAQNLPTSNERPSPTALAANFFDSIDPKRSSLEEASINFGVSVRQHQAQMFTSFSQRSICSLRRHSQTAHRQSAIGGPCDRRPREVDRLCATCQPARC